jgi:hypothetical protein
MWIFDQRTLLGYQAECFLFLIRVHRRSSVCCLHFVRTQPAPQSEAR